MRSRTSDASRRAGGIAVSSDRRASSYHPGGHVHSAPSRGADAMAGDKERSRVLPAVIALCSKVRHRPDWRASDRG